MAACCEKHKITCCDICACLNLTSTTNTIEITTDSCCFDFNINPNTILNLIQMNSSTCVTILTESIDGVLTFTPSLNFECILAHLIDEEVLLLTATNGLHVDPDTNVKLGGELIEATTIETDETNTLSITGLTEVDEGQPDFILVETSAGVVQKIAPEDLITGSEIVITADNGLNKDTATNVQLGGTLIKDTQVDTGDYDLLISKTVGDRTGLEIWTGLPSQVAKVTIISDISEDLVNIEEVRNGLIQLEISDLTDRNNADPGALDQGYYSKGIISVTDTYAKLAYHTQKVDVGNTPVFDDVNTARIIAEAGLIDITAILTQVSNNISIGNKVLVTEAVNKSVGTATLNNGTITVANTSITTNSRIFLSREAINGSTALGMLTYTKIANTSFTINSVQTSTPASLETGDDSIVSYFIIN